MIGLLLAGYLSLDAQDNIAAARAMGAGSEVTVTGIVTNGDELGLIRYMQDATGGIAVYSSALADVVRGDEVTVTGTLKDYNTLLEIDPVTSVTINSSGNTLPDPIVLTPDQLAEQYEGMLVKINNVDFDASGSFERNSYTFTADGEAGQIYINSFDSPLIGMVIPTNPVSVVGPLGAYSDTYQLLPRDQFDILSSSVINLTSVPVMTNLSTTGFTVSWATDVAGTTEAFYGNTMDLELGRLSVAGETTAHAIDLTGLAASELIYFQPFSVKDQDTIKAAVQVYITQSESSGDVKAYFNRPVDNSVSLGLLKAQYLDHSIDDTLINYINRAEESIDFTIYNFNNAGISNISDALNAAHDRGVIVRVIYDSNIDAVGVGGEPVQVFPEPGQQTDLLQFRDQSGLPEHLQGPGHLNEVDGVDDPDAPAAHPALDGLGVEEAGVHPRGRIQKPGFQVQQGVRGIGLFARELPCRHQGRHLHAQPPEGLPVGIEVVRVALPVPADVGPFRVFRIGPPVIALRIEVVDAALAALAATGGHSDRRFLQVAIGCADHPLIFHIPDVNEFFRST